MAKTLVGALRVTLGLDSAEFASGAAKASGISQKLRRNLLGIAAVAGVVVAGVALAVKGQLNAADEMGKAAQKFGVPVEALSRLKYAADLSDVSLETLGTGLKALSKNMADSPAKFEALGIALRDATGAMRPTEEVLQDVAGVFAAMPDGAEKTALAMKLFGKSGTEMLPMLNAGKTGLQAMAEEANRLGIVIDQKTAKAAEGFNDNLTRLQSAAGGLAVQLTAALAPAMETLSGYLVDLVNWFGQLSPETKEMIVQIAGIFAVVAAAAAGFGLLLLVISPVSLTIAAIAAGAALIIENWGPISEWFTNFWNDLVVVFQFAWDSIKTAIGGAIEYVTGLWDAFMAKLQAAVQIAKDVGQAISDALTSGAAGEGGLPFQPLGTPGALFSSPSGIIQMGINLGLGLAEGMSQSENEVAAAGASLGAAAGQGVADALGIQSPSRVAAGYGMNVAEGLAEGMTEGQVIVGEAAKSLSDTAAGALKGIGDLGARIGDMFATAATNVLTGVESLREAVGNLLQQLATLLINSAMKQLFGNIFGNLFGGLTGYATGTASAAQGWAMVGEEGPELVNFGGGERVYNARDTGRMMDGAGGGAARPVQVTSNFYMNDQLIHSAMETVGGESVINTIVARSGR